MTDTSNLGKQHDRRRDDDRRDNEHIHNEMRRLSQAPLSILNGWIELWHGYTVATQAAVSLLSQTYGRAAEEMGERMHEVRRDLRDIGQQTR